MPAIPKETKEEKSRRIRAEIDSKERRKLRKDAQAREREEANRARREQKAANQGQKHARGKPSGTDAERLPHLLVLELTVTQDTELEIKKAYKRLALIYHPDKNPSGEAKMKQINASYAALFS